MLYMIFKRMNDNLTNEMIILLTRDRSHELS